MPGPMGGGRGGGFSGGSRGGGFGGGSRGGGFSGGSRGPSYHGPHHHGHHHHHHGPIFFFGPRRRYYGGGHHGGGGCLTSIMSTVIAFAIIFAIILIMAIATADDDIGYEEQRFQEYADEQYYAAFSDTDNYEENILIVFTVFEGYNGYDCITWGGNYIDNQTETLFGSYFQSTVRDSIPDYYENAMTKSLRQIVDSMTKLAPDNASGQEVDTQYSKLYNYSSLEIDKTIVNNSLQEFTKKTGYPIAIVIANGEEVFGDEEDDSGEVIIAIIVIVMITIIAIIIIKSTNKNNGGNGGGASKTTDKTNPDAGQGKYDPNTGEWK